MAIFLFLISVISNVSKILNISDISYLSEILNISDISYLSVISNISEISNLSKISNDFRMREHIMYMKVRKGKKCYVLSLY